MNDIILPSFSICDMSWTQNKKKSINYTNVPTNLIFKPSELLNFIWSWTIDVFWMNQHFCMLKMKNNLVFLETFNQICTKT